MLRSALTLFLGFWSLTVVGFESEELTPEVRAQLMKPYPNPAWGGFEMGRFVLTRIEHNLYSFLDDVGTRNFFLVTEEGVIATDPVSVESGLELAAVIKSVTDQPVKYVIYSHNHWDHVEGGQPFKDQGATFISHERCRQRFVQRPNPDVVMPDITFSGNYTLELGGEKVELLYYGPNHSPCTVFMRLKNGKYLFVVDVVSPGAIPWGIAPDQDFDATIRTIEELEKLDFDVIIPGHGVPVTHPSALTERRLYLQALRNAVAAELAAGFDREFYNKVKARLAPYAYLRGFEFQSRQNIDAMLYYVGIGW